MKTPASKCKCLHCNVLFLPDYRNRSRQRYCSKPACRKISKQLSQKAWLAKPPNQTYFRDAANAERVRRWQAGHPGYWKRPPKTPAGALQDPCTPKSPVKSGLSSPSPPTSALSTLQDLCTLQTPLLVGLIASFVDSTLQEDIAHSTRRFIQKGRDILDVVSGMSARSP